MRLRRLTGDLSDATAAMRAMAVALDGHATATEEAKCRLTAAAGLATAGKYAANQTADDSREQRWALQATDDFHTSEQRVRSRLWQLGTDAPGGIPLPPQPHQNWWQAELFPSAFGAQQWLDKDGVPHAGNPRGYDPRHPLFGFDEDGNQVPAYEADPMAQHQIQDGIPLRDIISMFGSADISTAEEAEAAAIRTTTASNKWRFGRMHKHIREFFHLPGNPGDPVPHWAADERCGGRTPLLIARAPAMGKYGNTRSSVRRNPPISKSSGRVESERQ